MAAVPITVPGVGESITEGILSRWLKPDGVGRQGGRAPLRARDRQGEQRRPRRRPPGVLKIDVAEGETVAIGATSARSTPRRRPGRRRPPRAAGTRRRPPAARSRRRAAPRRPRSRRRRRPTAAPHAALAGRPAARGRGATSIPPQVAGDRPRRPDHQGRRPRPPGPPRRPAAPTAAAAGPPHPPPRPRPRAAPARPRPRRPARGRETRQRMSGIRQRIAQRLVEAQQTAAILTTFNEADMSRVMELRARYKDSFKTKHGVGARLHVVLRQGGDRGPQGLPGGQRPDRRQRHRLPQLSTTSAWPSAPSAA